ncbi:MAG: hypothetical protein ABW185_04400 [Sedimenticola sp.]
MAKSIPYPIEYYDRLEIARELHVMVNGNTPSNLHHMSMLVRDYGPLESMQLRRNDDSFYRSLSMWLFGNEDEHTLIHKAALKHVKSNRAYFDKIYDDNQRPGPSDVYEHMRWAAKSGQQASNVDVHAVANLTGTAIYLFGTDTDTPRAFLPENRKHSNRAIFLAAKPTGDGYTFQFSPVIAYERRGSRKQRKDGGEPIDNTKAVTFVAKDEESTVVVPYDVAKEVSQNTAEFCGEAIQTDMNLQTLCRLKSFFVEGALDMLDHDLYRFARRWSISSLSKRMEDLLEHAALTDVVNFANHTALCQDEAIYEILKRRLYHAPVAEMKNSRLQPRSKTHTDLNEYLSTLADCRDNSRPLISSYTAPHVVVCLESDYAYLEYFNGIKWHSVYMPPAIRSVIPHLRRDSNRYCVARDRLIFVKDRETLGCVTLLGNFDARVSYADVPKGVSNPRIASTDDPDTVLLMSEEIDRMISKVTIKRDGQLDVSPWISVKSENYRFQFLDNAGIVYTIDGYRCALSTDGTSCSKFGVSPEGSVYRYDMCSEHEISAPSPPTTTTIRIPKRHSGTYVLVARNSFCEHMSCN